MYTNARDRDASVWQCKGQYKGRGASVRHCKGQHKGQCEGRCQGPRCLVPALQGLLQGQVQG